jgi:hypothetical protein
MGNWIGPIAGLDTLEKREHLYTCQEWNAIQFVPSVYCARYEVCTVLTMMRCDAV